MKKFISIVLTISILLTNLFISSYVQNKPIVEAAEMGNGDSTILITGNPTENSTFLFTKFLKKFDSTKKFADTLEKIKLLLKDPSNLFEKAAEKSLFLTLLFSGFFVFNAVITRAQGFMYAVYLWEHFKEKLSDGFSWMHRVKSVPLEEVIFRLNKGLLELKGQENAKKEIRKIVYGIAHNKNQAAFNKEEYSHGDIIYILGPSGVGKTFVSLRIAKALSNQEPFIISASEVDLNNKETVIDQLFNFDCSNYGYGAGLKESKRLVKYLQNHKGGVVIINEYDKMWSPALDEVMRTISDQGIVSIRGQVIDCRDTTFIITSNECTKAITSGNQDNIIDDKEIDDGTGSRTNSVKHDKSFLNRVKKVVFDNLTEKDYEDIVRTEYGEKFKNYWKDIANVDLDLEDVYNKIAKKAVQENNGSRIINSVMDGLNKELGDFTIKNPKEKDGSKNNNFIMKGLNKVLERFAHKNPKDKDALPIKLHVSYDVDKDEFILNTKD